MSQIGLDESGQNSMGNQQELISSLKNNLQSLESKIGEIRNQRQKQKNDITAHQAKLNMELTKIVVSHKTPGKDEVEKVVGEEVVRRPTSLTKENIKLRQENERLKERVLDRDRELERMAVELKNIRKSRDDAMDRIEELNKIIERRHEEDGAVARKANEKGMEAEQGVREQRVELVNIEQTAGEEGRVRGGGEEGRHKLLADVERCKGWRTGVGGRQFVRADAARQHLQHVAGEG
jgi:chromosome segregation ATPase